MRWDRGNVGANGGRVSCHASQDS